MGELLARADQMSATDFAKQSEDEIGSAISYMGTISSKIAGYEKQLEEMMRKVEGKHKQFEAEVEKMKKAQKLVLGLTPQYEKAKTDLEPKVAEIDKELGAIAKTVDAKLMERYRRARGQIKSLKPIDIVIPIVGNQCGGCMFEMPLSRIHTITQDGYVVCEECGKIIFKS
jgi:predicted  nucleic acid-binding Zn-ribbon protein